MTRAWPGSLALVTLLALAPGCGSDSDSDGSGATGGVGASGGSAGSAGGGSGGTAGGSGGSAGSAGSAGSGPCALGSSWQLVDDYTFASPEPTFGIGIAADPAGSVYLAGLGKQGTMTGIVRKSTDGGQTWNNVTWGQGLPNDIDVDAAGNVYVMAGVGPNRVLRKSTNGGDSWEDIDTFPINGGLNEPCNPGFVAIGAGGVIVDGGSCDLGGWMVRKSTNGTDFEQVFTFQLAPGKMARVEDVGVGPGGAAFATGAALDASDVSHWLTVTEGAVTGTVSDDLQLAANQNANPRKLGKSEPPMVAGFASDGNTTHAIVRRLSGSGWSTIDTFPTHASDVVQVGAQLVVAGQITENAIDRVVTRISVDGGASFAPLDEYEYAPGKNARSVAITHDGAGNVYAAIGAQDDQDVNHLLVRKLSCQ